MLTLLCYTFFFLFFFNDTATTEIYTLSLHDALPIYAPAPDATALLVEELRNQISRLRTDLDAAYARESAERERHAAEVVRLDRKSTRLNSSHANISYAVFCLKKKKKRRMHLTALSPI